MVYQELTRTTIMEANGDLKRGNKRSLTALNTSKFGMIVVRNKDYLEQLKTTIMENKRDLKKRDSEDLYL